MKREQENIDSQELTLTELMFEFVRAAVLERDPVIPQDAAIDWNRLMDISTEQGLIAWVWDGICRLPQEQQPPRQHRINWGLSAQEIWERYAHQKEILTEMVNICRQNDMRLLLMKGIGLSEMYPKPQSRPSGDIDIYLFDDFEKGNKLFSGQKCPETELHTSFTYKGIEVENHKIFVYNNSRVKGLVGKYILNHVNDAVLTEKGYYTLSPMPNLAYLLMHALNHVNYGSEDTIMSIRNILDLGMFVRHNKCQLPHEEVFRTLRMLGLDRSFELVVYLSEWLLDINLNEYHAGLIRRKDVVAIHELFTKQGFSLPVDKSQSLVKQSCALWKRYFQLRPVAWYIPKKPKCSLFRVTIHRQNALLIRRLLGVPEGCTIKEGIKFKLRKTR